MSSETHKTDIVSYKNFFYLITNLLKTYNNMTVTKNCTIHNCLYMTWYVLTMKISADDCYTYAPTQVPICYEEAYKYKYIWKFQMLTDHSKNYRIVFKVQWKLCF